MYIKLGEIVWNDWFRIIFCEVGKIRERVGFRIVEEIKSF